MIRIRAAIIGFASVLAAVTFALTASPGHAAEPSTPDSAHLASTGGGNPIEVQTSADCVYYLRVVGYEVGPKRTDACNRGEGGTGAAHWVCSGLLQSGGVTAYHADNACTLAAR
ncbi:hypothetical protein [Glycomyces harbinensis]|uniref:Secreted protein n=1 Tax=Glycomyces harbinensis TaxID=58114 RepID=A0A1G6XEL9_9ACTN|nr:hypothetical protein [Glycomyces harbinensis]SDD76512.1 hypothetical protein SAMN05216270_107127 [Glycomyces harbinensis]